MPDGMCSNRMGPFYPAVSLFKCDHHGYLPSEGGVRRVQGDYLDGRRSHGTLRSSRPPQARQPGCTVGNTRWIASRGGLGVSFQLFSEPSLPSKSIMFENLFPIAVLENYSILLKKLRKRFG